MKIWNISGGRAATDDREVEMRNQTKLDLAKSTEAQPDLQNKKKNCDRCATHMGWHLRWLWVVMSTKTMIHGGDGWRKIGVKGGWPFMVFENILGGY